MDEKIVSLCKVIQEWENNNVKLLRLADIHNGQIEPFVSTDTESKLFEDSPYIYWNNRSKEVIQFGIWEWSAKANIKDETKPYFEAEHRRGEHFFEIILTDHINSLDGLADCLKEGLCCKLVPVSDRLIVAYREEEDLYRGLVLDKKREEFELKEEYLRVSEEIISLQRKDFRERDVFSHSQRKFYTKMDVEQNSNQILLKTPFEIVQQLLRKYFTNEKFKTLGLSRKDGQKYKNILDKISESSILTEVQKYLKCSSEEARSHIDEFISRVNEYISGEDVDSIDIQSVIENHSVMREKFEKVALELWKKEHAKETSDLQNELDKVRKEVDAVKAEDVRVQTLIKEAENQLAILESTISQKEELIREIEEKMHSRLKQAKENIADFLVENAFYHSIAGTADVAKNLELSRIYTKGQILDFESDQYHSIEDLLDILEGALDEAGVSNKYQKELAIFLASSYFNKFALLLAGPFGENIANALSVSLFGKTSGSMDCLKAFDEAELRRMLSSDDTIIILKNAFNTEWLKYIPNIVMNQNKFFVITTPYAEDLIIEPRGIFNYMFPILTELFIDKIPKNDFRGGLLIGEAKLGNEEFLPVEYRKQFQSLGMNKFLFDRIQCVFSGVFEMNYSIKEIEKCIYLLGLFPYAYVIDKAEFLLETIKIKNDKELQKIYGILTQYLGVNLS